MEVERVRLSEVSPVWTSEEEKGHAKGRGDGQKFRYTSCSLPPTEETYRSRLIY